jgi:hypothetical protein
MVAFRKITKLKECGLYSVGSLCGAGIHGVIYADSEGAELME